MLRKKGECGAVREQQELQIGTEKRILIPSKTSRALEIKW